MWNSNAIDLLCSGQVPKSGVERDDFELNFEEVPQLFTPEERDQWLQKLSEVAVSSDAFFPFSDNVYRLARSGAKYAAAPTGSVNDEVCLQSLRKSKS
jgi:phosphoribosylaminoimidazolecarboxamide formyltransferase/IMP cyclohydrolase